MQADMKRIVKTVYANRFGEAVLAPWAIGRPPESFAVKCLPENTLYRRPTLRRVVRSGLNFEVDLSDLIGWYIYFRILDPSLAYYFSRLKKQDCILDIGANIGYTSLRAAQIASQGSVFGFEPSHYNYQRSVLNIGLNKLSNVSLARIAMGSTDGFAFIATKTENNLGMNQISNAEAGNERVKMTTIDSWLQHANDARPDVIKIDVEGFEMEVLRGARETLQTCRPKLFVEVNDMYLKAFGSSAAELIEWLLEHRYKLMATDGTEITHHSMLSAHQDIWAEPILRH